jgi:hypothetical protein
MREPLLQIEKGVGLGPPLALIKRRAHQTARESISAPV